MDTSHEHMLRIQEQFRRQAEAYEQMADVQDRKGLRGLVRLSGAGPDSRVLDIACGPGFLTLEFAEVAKSVVGFDATDTFLEHARKEADRRAMSNVEFRQGNATALPFADASFDVVSCRAAFHHFPEPERQLAEMARVLAPGGRILIADQIASEDPVKAAYHHEMEMLCDPTHARTLSDTEFRRLFEQHGLEVVRHGTAPNPYSVQSWMSHGGPSAENAAKIEAMMRDSLDVDRSGLDVRMQDGEIWFSHTGAAYLLKKKGS